MPVIKFQPTRPLRGATHGVLHAEHRQEISTHAPLAGRDATLETVYPGGQSFQPTRPLRGATLWGCAPYGK